MGEPSVRAVSARLVLPDRDSTTIALAACHGDAHMPQQELGPEEIRRAHELRNPKALCSFLRGRLAAKAALGELRGGLGGPFEVVNCLFGRPLVQVPNADLAVSISHHRDAAVAAASPAGWPLGIDLTFINERDAETIRRQVGRDEECRLHALGIAPDAAATALWAAKEALSKVLGGGFGINFELLAIEEAIDRAPGLRLRFRHVGHIEADIVIGANHVVALALPYHTHLDWGAVGMLFQDIPAR